ncbi:MAG: hypothetical protein KIT68_00850 [Phycisphaeraceae bacterium]|nr:hypothetical protein [Phycisphaeraceae bacterium]
MSDAPNPAASSNAPQPSGSEESIVPLRVPLPELVAPYGLAEVEARLDAAARRGRLAGFETIGRSQPDPVGQDVFEASAFGAPFDGVLIATCEQVLPDGGTVLSFRAHMKPLMPWVVAVVLVLTVWPGVVVTESMLASMFPTWDWLWGTTWYWYLALTAPFVPWVLWRSVSRSRAVIHDSAHKAVASVAKELGAEFRAAARA